MNRVGAETWGRDMGEGGGCRDTGEGGGCRDTGEGGVQGHGGRGGVQGHGGRGGRASEICHDTHMCTSQLKLPLLLASSPCLY